MYVYVNETIDENRFDDKN